MAEPVQKSAAAQRTALVAGSNGFVGAKLLKLLLQANGYQRTHALSRRPLPLDHPRLANRIMPLEQVEERLHGVGCDDAFCCIGSTLRTAGSAAELRRVDVDLAVAFARAARANGAERFVVLSSVGAAADSRHAYLRNKAELEARLTQLNYPALDILRPGLLLGWRDELRPTEFIGTLLMPLVNPLLGGKLARFRGIDAADVAAAMLGAAYLGRRGRNIHSGAALHALAAAGRRAARTSV